MVKDFFVNERIRAPEVRLIGAEGKQMGVVKTQDAQRLAREQGLDLILISPTASPPVARISDFGKFKYEQTKHDKVAKKAQKASIIKEVKLTPKIGEHDLQVRVSRSREFLTKKNRVKVSVFFRGREVTHKEYGRKVLDKLVLAVADIGVPEGTPKMEGRNMVLLVVPK
ncbi:MAG: translation initiation factor IF-3 [Candidatus Margulisiibacteriota bacterium]